MLSKQDVARLEFGVKKYTLEKFDGQKVKGDGKKPVETIEITEGQDTVHVTSASGKKVVISIEEFNRLIKDNSTKMIQDHLGIQQSLNFKEE